MDAAATKNLMHRLKIHQAIAQIFLIFATLLPLKGFDALVIFCGFILSNAIFHKNIQRRYTYNGYGVACNINAYMKHPLMKTPRILLNKTVPVALARNWATGVLLVVCTGLVGVFKEQFGITNTNVIGALWCFTLVYPSILIAEMYLWYAVERRFHWYLDEVQLFRLLHGVWPREKISELSVELQKMNLVIRS
jgi:hypothetical protein